MFSKARFSYEFRFTVAPARKSIQELTAEQIRGSANVTKMFAPNATSTMKSIRPNTIDVFNAGRCFDQRRPIQERPESPCENGTADDLLWRFQISQSICTSKTFTSAPHRPSALRSPLALGVGKPVRRGLGSQSFSMLEWRLHGGATPAELERFHVCRTPNNCVVTNEF